MVQEKSEAVLTADSMRVFGGKHDLSDLEITACCVLAELRILAKRLRSAVPADDDLLPAPLTPKCFLVETPKKKRSRRADIEIEYLNKAPPLVQTPEKKETDQPPLKKQKNKRSGRADIEIEDLNKVPPLVQTLEKKETDQQPLKKQKKKKPIKNDEGRDTEFPSRDMPLGLRDHIQGFLSGTDVLLVAEKFLTDSDISRSMSRLLLPVSQIKSPQFLSDEEKETLKVKVGKRMNGIDVSVIEPLAGTTSRPCPSGKVSLKRWEMTKKNGSMTPMYALGSGWNKIVSRNKLKTGDAIQVWSFRVSQQLHLALLVVV